MFNHSSSQHLPVKSSSHTNTQNHAVQGSSKISLHNQRLRHRKHHSHSKKQKSRQLISEEKSLLRSIRASCGSYLSGVFPVTTRVPLVAQGRKFSEVHGEDDGSLLLMTAHELGRQCEGCLCGQVDDEKMFRPSLSGRQQRDAQQILLEAQPRWTCAVVAIVSATVV